MRKFNRQKNMQKKRQNDNILAYVVALSLSVCVSYRKVGGGLSPMVTMIGSQIKVTLLFSFRLTMPLRTVALLIFHLQ